MWRRKLGSPGMVSFVWLLAVERTFFRENLCYIKMMSSRGERFFELLLGIFSRIFISQEISENPTTLQIIFFCEHQNEQFCQSPQQKSNKSSIFIRLKNKQKSVENNFNRFSLFLFVITVQQPKNRIGLTMWVW